MTSYSDQLLELQVQIAEKEHIETKLHNLRTQKEDLEYSVSKLSYEKTLENEDVENLEGGSLLGFILRLTGGYEKRLAKNSRKLMQQRLSTIPPFLNLKR